MSGTEAGKMPRGKAWMRVMVAAPDSTEVDLTALNLGHSTTGPLLSGPHLDQSQPLLC